MTEPERLFTQEEVNRMVANERRKTQNRIIQEIRKKGLQMVLLKQVIPEPRIPGAHPQDGDNPTKTKGADNGQSV